MKTSQETSVVGTEKSGRRGGQGKKAVGRGQMQTEYKLIDFFMDLAFTL